MKKPPPDRSEILSPMALSQTWLALSRLAPCQRRVVTVHYRANHLSRYDVFHR